MRNYNDQHQLVMMIRMMLVFAPLDCLLVALEEIIL